MPLTAFQQPVYSDPATDFADAISVGAASPTVNLQIPTRDPNYFIRALQLSAVENCTYEAWFFSKAINMQSTLAASYFLWAVQFALISTSAPATVGAPVTIPSVSPDDGLFRYMATNLMLPCADLDLTSNDQGSFAKIHCRLVNRQGTKSSGAGGAVQLGVFWSPQGAQV